MITLIKNGKVTGYSIGIYDDGSKIFSRVDGVAQTSRVLYIQKKWPC